MAKFAVLMTIGDLALRDATRPEHRVYLKQLFDAGKLHESGPFADGKGALLIYNAADEAEARAILANDPYSKATGVIAGVDVREWGITLPPQS